MPFRIDTAENYQDLLDQTRLFVTKHGWIEKRWIEKSANGESELLLEGKGISGQDQIFVGIKTYSDTGQDYFNWQLQGMVGFDNNYSFEEQPGVISQEPPSLALWDKPIPYWLVVNASRIILVAKVSTIYVSMYLGFLKVYGTPGQYPYPLIIGGSLTQNPKSQSVKNYRWSNTQGEHRCFADPGYNNDDTSATVFQRQPTGFWQPYGNRKFDDQHIYYGDHYHHIWPTVNESAIQIREGLSGERMLFPLVMYEREVPRANTAKNVWGEFEGCFFVSGFGVSAEDTITIGSDTYLIVPNIHRTGVSDYWALKLA
jgi:hypothetical protein